jgi:hypothetical protein
MNSLFKNYFKLVNRERQFVDSLNTIFLLFAGRRCNFKAKGNITIAEWPPVCPGRPYSFSQLPKF